MAVPSFTQLCPYLEAKLLDWRNLICKTVCGISNNRVDPTAIVHTAQWQTQEKKGAAMLNAPRRRSNLCTISYCKKSNVFKVDVLNTMV